MAKINELARLGQSIWLDYIRRSLITSGELKDFIEQGITGVTSNPTIFEKAIAGTNDYDNDIKELSGKNKSTPEIYEELAVSDIKSTADILLSAYERSSGRDGFVSLEVSPDLAYDTEGTVLEARRLFKTLGRPNVMIKVPATKEGIPAIETLISEGINVNVTLLFSISRYKESANAYISGLEKLSASGNDISPVASVASFFVSRVDTAVDRQLETNGKHDLMGKIAIANSKAAYAVFKELFTGPRWQALSDKGAQVQRLLWASTGTKNPAYPDTMYLDDLIGEHTVNTVPPDTLRAYLDHGVAAGTLDNGLKQAQSCIDSLSDQGIDLDDVTDKLQKVGVGLFSKSFESLINSIEEKRQSLTMS